MTFLSLMLMALLVELAVGWPAWLYARIRHPVVWMGSLIDCLDTALNDADRSHRFRLWSGAMTALIVVAVSAGIASLISYYLPDTYIGFVVQAMVASSLFATRSLYEHVNAVAIPLVAGNRVQAREALSHIVGRDTSALDESGISGAAIESLAENSSDGVFAPLFWGLLFGLPGIAAYKAINTLDSMIGHRSEKYRAFGRVSAKLDDTANIVPSRLSAVLISFAGGSLHQLAAIVKDAKTHRSPNAGWPESAMAYALQRRLSGPRTYHDIVGYEPWINGSSANPQAVDVLTGLGIYKRSLAIILFLLVVVLVAF